MAWDRETPWRQGSVLPPEALGPLGLSHPEDPENTIAVVISHDCDLANDDLGLEPHVEVIVGRCIGVARGDSTNAKVPRRLHLTFTSKSESLVVELLATAKVLVQKENLALFQPDAWGLSESEHSVLQRWLGVRYRRAAFPDAFEGVLRGAKLHERIAKILDPLGYAISAIFFDVQEGEGLYSLGILLLYDTGRDPERAEAIAEKAAKEIEVAFASKLYDKASGWRGIELAYCEPVSDEAMTYRQSTMLKQWRLDYLSLRSEPQQAMTEE